jgi:hypothetical protein
MKFSLFSLAALAASAMAAPAAQVAARQVPAVPAVAPNGAVSQVESIATSQTVTKTVTKKITAVNVSNTGGVVKVLTIAVEQVKSQTTTISKSTNHRVQVT